MYLFLLLFLISYICKTGKEWQNREREGGYEGYRVLLFQILKNNGKLEKPRKRWKSIKGLKSQGTTWQEKRDKE